jgi:hypothetical protein
MSIRMLVLAVVVVGAAGQQACSTEVEAAQPASTRTPSEPSFAPCEGEGKFCGGIAGFQCSPGLECVDDPSDTCDPDRGGADCGGICVCANTLRR